MGERSPRNMEQGTAGETQRRWGFWFGGRVKKKKRERRDVVLKPDEGYRFQECSAHSFSKKNIQPIPLTSWSREDADLEKLTRHIFQPSNLVPK